MMYIDFNKCYHQSGHYGVMGKVSPVCIVLWVGFISVSRYKLELKHNDNNDVY